MKILWLLIILIPASSFANWICREASSTRSGNSILACGIGEANSVQVSKDRARESAISEFNRICELSVDCKEFQSQVIPKRTECINENHIYKCYRAIEFIITQVKKKNIIVDVELVKDELQKKKSELVKLEAYLENVKELNEQKIKIEKIQNEISQIEGERIELSELVSPKAIVNNEFKYTHLLYDNSFRISLGYTGWNLTSSDEKNLTFNLSYEYRLSYNLGLQAGVGFGGDFSSELTKSESDIPNTYISNSNQNYLGPQTTMEYTLATNIYLGIWGTYLKGEVGNISFKRKSYNVDYGPIGTKTKTVELNNDGSKGFWGVFIGLDSREDKKGYGGFVEFGIRNINNKPNASINLGANYGF